MKVHFNSSEFSSKTYFRHTYNILEKKGFFLKKSKLYIFGYGCNSLNLNLYINLEEDNINIPRIEIVF